VWQRILLICFVRGPPHQKNVLGICKKASAAKLLLRSPEQSRMHILESVPFSSLNLHSAILEQADLGDGVGGVEQEVKQV
jgi:hypothetical protein